MKQQPLERLFRLGSVQNLILMSFSEKSSQPKMANFSSNLSYMNDECAELLWDNCPIVMQDHPKSSFQTTFPPFHSRVQEKDDSKFDPLAKIEHLRAVEQKSNNFAGNAQAQDDDAFVRWIEDDYCSDFFNMNPINSQSIRSSSSDHAVFTNYSHHPEKVHASKLNRVQLTPLFPFTESSEMDTNLEEDIDRSKRIKAMTSGAKIVLGIRQDEEVILAKQSNAVCEDDDNSRNKPYSSSPERKIQSSSFAENMTTLGKPKSDKGNNEVALDSTSICSDSNAVTAIAEQKRCDKKKLLLQGEESGYQSDEDTEEKFTDLKPDIVQGKSKKRSRMAEVHNLSERRRRDRINEKMRALQELIPNCNKNDKASTLDDAIEYLKSLQLQVQIMSMASSLCISPVMMQQVQGLSNGSTHFSPMGLGMGMGIGCMGLYDLNAASGCSFIPVPPVQGPQGFAVTMPYQPPCASLAADTKTSSGTHTAPTSSEDKTLEELQKPNTVDDLQNIHSTKALKEYGKRSSMTHLSDLPSLTSF